MPHIDKRTGEIVIRVVYDGAQEAGKTTNIQALCERVSLQRRGKMASPESKGPNTVFFDWLDFAGGFINGRSVRCQLVGVPGQSSLLRRRRYLLEDADVVVFVADSNPADLATTKSSFGLLRKALDQSADSKSAPVVLQANKQDTWGALDPETLRSKLEATEDIPVLPAQAHTGEGVLQTFSLAVRLATERIHELVAEGTLAGIATPGILTPDELHVAMLEAEKLARVQDESHSASPQTASSERQTIRKSLPQGLSLPRSDDVPAGCFWPPQDGRAILTQIGELEFERAIRPSPWCPRGATEIKVADTWLLHTSDDWLYPKIDLAKAALVQASQPYKEGAPGVPSKRSFFIARSDTCWRLWMVSPQIESLAMTLRRVVRLKDEDAILRALEKTMYAVRQFATRQPRPQPFIGLSHVAVTGSNVWDLRHPGSKSEIPVASVDVRLELKQLLLSVMEGDAERAACFRRAAARMKNQKGELGS